MSTFDKKTREQVEEQLNRTIFQEEIKRCIRREIEKFEARFFGERDPIPRTEKRIPEREKDRTL